MAAIKKKLDLLFSAHAATAIIVGGSCCFIPHSLASSLAGGSYGHMVHELVRLYGALTLAQGWLVWQNRYVADAFVRRTFCQAYCLCFLLQALALFRAQISSPESHNALNWFNIILLFSLGGAYGYFLVFKTIKAFELPGVDRGN